MPPPNPRSLADLVFVHPRTLPRRRPIDYPVPELPLTFDAGLKARGVSWQPRLNVSNIGLLGSFVITCHGIGLTVDFPKLVRHPGLRRIPLSGFADVEIAAVLRPARHARSDGAGGGVGRRGGSRAGEPGDTFQSVMGKLGMVNVEGRKLKENGLGAAQSRRRSEFEDGSSEFNHQWTLTEVLPVF